MIIISPALTIDLEKVCNNYGFTLKHSAINDINKNKECHRHVYSDGDLKLIIEIKKDDQ